MSDDKDQGIERDLLYEDIPNENLGVFLLKRMREFGDEIALVDGATEKRYTFNQLVERTERCAAGLQKIGVAKGDVICIASPNHKDYVVAAYATCLVSGVVQTINPTYTKDDISISVKNCNTKFLVTVPALLPKVKEGLEGHEDVKIILFGEADGCIPFKSLLDPANGGYTTPEVDPKTTVALLLSSSGTTGWPKAVRIPHFAIIAHIMQVGAPSVKLIRRGDVCMLFLPLFHIYGLCVLAMSNHAHGANNIIIPKFIPDDFLRFIDKYKPRLLNVVPPVMVMLAKHPKLSDYDLSSVVGITCGAAPLSPKIEAEVKARLKLEHINQGYGMTEAGVSHLCTEDAYVYKSVGKALPLTEVKVVDAETEQTLGTGEQGEIWLKGPQSSLGYLNMPRETEEVFLADGWVRTGDVGKEDENGFLFVVDRIKEIMKYKGFQVAPAVLEDAMLHHDDVVDVGVVGVPDDEAGDLPKAFVVRKPGSEVTSEELVAYVSERVPPFMKLRGGVEFIDQIPRSLSGKILRRSLRERAAQQAQKQQ